MKTFDDNNDGMSAITKKWYEEYPKAEGPSKHGKSEMEVMDLKLEAKKCLDSESTAYHLRQSKSKNSEYSWLKTALSKGTISDRVAAGIVLVQNSPKHNLNHLTTLVSQVKVAKHNQCSMVITAIRDLFLTDLLHPEYKLLKFEDQNLDELDNYNTIFKPDDDLILQKRPTLSKNKLLANWYFEDQLKEIYERFVTSLSTIANDTIDTNREKAVAVINDLLMGNAEQEHKLLDFLVNKIGDPGSKVASKAVFCLTKLLYEHSNMKLIVLKEVEKLLFRTNIGPRAQYFAICLLTQFHLSKEDTEVAMTLINVYFAFFKACLKKGEPDSRMMSAILAGVNRAYRFSDKISLKLNEHIDSIYKVVHVGSFNVSLNALNLLFQVSAKDLTHSNRFYSAFYRKLLDPKIGTSNKKAIFLNLLFRVLRNDSSTLRLHAFIKRILQVCSTYTPNMTCATLYVVSQVLQSKKLVDKILTKSVSSVSNDKNDVNDFTKNRNKKSKNNENTIVLSNIVVDNSEDKDPEDIKSDEIVEVKNEFNVTSYDPFNRNPLQSGAKLSLYYELTALTQHFHPSVSLFASKIILGKPIDYTGDPLQDLSLIRFLDRYVFKNPKKLESKRVVKKNDPLAQRAAYTPKGIRSIPVDSSAYLNESEEKIPVDEMFLYTYLTKRNEGRPVQQNTSDDDNDSVCSEEFDELMNNFRNNDTLENLDIAGNLSFTSKSKNKDESEDEDDFGEENDEDITDDDENSDMELENLDGKDDDDEFQDLDDLELDDLDDDLSDIEFSDDDEELIETSTKKRKQNKLSGNKTKKSKSSDEKTFVSAEEFAEMLEKQGHSKFKHGASRNMSDRDGASAKQLDWETERHQRIRGFQGMKSRKNFNQKKKFKSQRPIKRKK